MEKGATRAFIGPIGRGVECLADGAEPPGKDHRERRGLTIVEITITMAILIVVLAGFAQAMLASMVASKAHREASLAADGARRIVERLQASEFDDAFKAFNSTPADNAGALDVLPAGFAVAGLQPRANDPDGLVGRILFPEVVGSSGIELREDLQSFSLDMPRDLNGDGVVDAANHATDYEILPVVVRVEWRGAAGPGTFEYKTILSDF